MLKCLLLVSSLAFFASAAGAEKRFATDVLSTSLGDLVITPIGHGTLMFAFGGKVIHVDPWGKLADYGQLPKADLVLVTHDHPDHLDPDAIRAVTRSGTLFFVNAASASQIPGSVVLSNGDARVWSGVTIEAVPAYNLVHKRADGRPYHSKGEGNGYVLGFGDTRVYVAGDTENTPEMKALKNITCAFLPMNLPYTMTPAMVADAARAFRPKMLYPYHFGDTDPSVLVGLLKGTSVEVRLRALK